MHGLWSAYSERNMLSPVASQRSPARLNRPNQRCGSDGNAPPLARTSGPNNRSGQTAPLKTTLTGGSEGARTRPANRRSPRIQSRVDMPCSPLVAENIDIGQSGDLRRLLYDCRARALVTSSHFSFSWFMNNPESGPHRVPTSAPVTLKLFRTLGLYRTRSMSAVTLDKISVGVFAGANTPNQEVDPRESQFQLELTSVPVLKAVARKGPHIPRRAFPMQWERNHR